jgi:hypothetical protein
MNKIIFIILAALLNVAATAQERKTWDVGATAGTVFATFNPANGTLTISGKGAMKDYQFGEGAPWYSPYFWTNPYYDEIKKVKIESGVTAIGDFAFNDCTSIASVIISNTVTRIGIMAFCSCYLLTAITIPNSVTSIEKGAFSSCLELTSVTIPNSVTAIGIDAFRNCSGLTSVVIPNSVTTIGMQAFTNCSNLAAVTISNRATTIGRRAFACCHKLADVKLPKGIKSIGIGAFDATEWNERKWKDYPKEYRIIVLTAADADHVEWGYFDKLRETYPQFDHTLRYLLLPPALQFTQYTYGQFLDFEDARKYRKRFSGLSYKDCYIGVFENGKQIL